MSFSNTHHTTCVLCTVERCRIYKPAT